MKYLKSEETEQELIEHFREIEEDGVGFILDEDDSFMYRWEPYALKFTSNGSQTLSLIGHTSSAKTLSFEYSYTGSRDDWHEWEVVSSSANTPQSNITQVEYSGLSFGTLIQPCVYIRGTNNGLAINSGASSGCTFKFENDQSPVSVSGYILGLLSHYPEVAEENTSSYKFPRLFDSQTALYSVGGISMPKQIKGSGNFYAICFGCTNLIDTLNLSGVTAPISTFDYAYSGCTSLTSISLPPSIEYADYAMFAACQNVTNLTLSEGLKRIQRQAFDNLTGLTSVYLPSTLLGRNSLANNPTWGGFRYSKITDIYISDLESYLNLGSDTNGLPFENNTSAHHLYLNGSEVTNADMSQLNPSTLQRYGFAYCGNLTAATLPSVMPQYLSSTTSVFLGCTGLTSMVIPSGYTVIPQSFFVSCSGLTSVTLSSEITYIGNYAFAQSGIKTFTFPDAYTTLGAQYIFQKCVGLEEVDFNNVTASTNSNRLNYYFQNCTSLTKIHVPSVQAYMDTCPYKITTWNNSSPVNLPLFNAPDSEPRFFYIGNSECRDLVIPSGVTTIWAASFAKFNRLTSVVMDNSVTGIGVSAFTNCSSLSSVTLSNNLAAIPGSCFSNCSNLTGLTFPSSVTGIGAYAFTNCTSLTDITIPSSVTNFGEKIFNGSQLHNLYILTTGVTLPVSILETSTANQSGDTFECMGSVLGTMPARDNIDWKNIIIHGDLTIGPAGGYMLTTYPGFTSIRIGGDLVLNNACLVHTYSRGQCQLEFIEVNGSLTGTQTSNCFGYNSASNNIKNGCIVHFGNSDVATTPARAQASWSRIAKYYVGDGSSQAADQAVLNKYLADTDWANYSSKLDLWYNYTGPYKTT